MGVACITSRYWLVPAHVISRRRLTSSTGPRGVARVNGPMSSRGLNIIKCAVNGGMDMMGKISSSWTTSMGGYLIARCSASATVTHIKCQLRAHLWSLPARG
ncbi:unknown [Beak and feather disease virus]|nr:unknown [Beak and feather disease virus]